MHGLIKPGFVSHQTSCHNTRTSIKGCSIPRAFSWIENYKQTDFCKVVTKHVSPNILRTEHYYSSKKRKKSFKIFFTGKTILLTDVSFNCWKAGFEGDKLTHVLKVTLLQICLFLYVCIRIKQYPKHFYARQLTFY